MAGYGARFGRGMLAATLFACAVPGAAQFSEGFNFLKAVRDRDGEKVTTALEKPGTTIVNSKGDDGDTALHIVVKRRDMTWLTFLLAKGARVDVRDRDGNTPVAVAAQIGFVDGVRMLADRGAVNLGNSRGETPLILAVRNRDLAMVRLLLSAGANPRQADRVTGKSALDIAGEDNRATAILKALQDTPAPRPVSGPTL